MASTSAKPGDSKASGRNSPERQRGRILQATAELVASRGYHGTTVELIAERAGLSNKTFYGHFANREECFLACMAEIATYGGERIESEIAARSDWMEQVRAGIGAFLDYVVEEPARARTFLVESMGAGAAALELFEQTLTRFAAYMRVGRQLAPPGAQLPEILEDSILGGLVWLVHQRLVAGEIEDVPALLPRMVKFTLAPYLGEERATAFAAECEPRGASSVPVNPSRATPKIVPPRVRSEQAFAQIDPEVPMRPLRSGRGGIPPELVARNQRDRLLAAVARVVAENGYNQTTITQITAAASVSRQTFYQQFESKEAAFCAAYDAAVARIDAEVVAAIATGSGWPGQVAAAIRALLGFLAANPDLARLCFVEAAAVGTGTVAQRDADSSRFVALLAYGRRHHPGATDPGEGTEEALVGGITTLLTRRVLAGEASQLERFAAEMIEFTLAPYLGATAAQAAADL